MVRVEFFLPLFRFLGTVAWLGVTTFHLLHVYRAKVGVLKRWSTGHECRKVNEWTLGFRMVVKGS